MKIYFTPMTIFQFGAMTLLETQEYTKYFQSINDKILFLPIISIVLLNLLKFARAHLYAWEQTFSYIQVDAVSINSRKPRKRLSRTVTIKSVRQSCLIFWIKLCIQVP